ncbi:MAG: hypothetical protein KBA91_03715 [Candidatus Moranbacteria bacterium]|jgi:hypothetical protein|nr:hypothetical protein [Candidatus Moranbacteria bacterium]
MKRIQDTFLDIVDQEPAPTLRSRILVSLKEEQLHRLARRRLISFSGLGVSISVFAVGAVQYGGALFQSDFWHIFSLLFSDMSVVLLSFQDFAYSLLETLPAVPLFALLAPLALFFWSAGFLLSLSERPSTKSFQHHVGVY